MFHELVEHVISSGQQAGEFADFEPSFVQRAVNGVLFETLREQCGPSGRLRERRPLHAADFVVRALLVDHESLADPEGDAEPPRRHGVSSAPLTRGRQLMRISFLLTNSSMP